MAIPARSVGVVVDALTQPEWVCHVIAHIRAVHRLAFVAVVAAPPSREPQLARLLRRVDDLFFGRCTSGLERRDITPLIDDVPVVNHPSSYAADVVIAFAPFASGASNVWHVEQDGLAEFAARAETMQALLRNGTRVLARTTAMPDAISLRRALGRLGWRTASMIEHELDRASEPPAIGETGPAALERHDMTNGRVLLAAGGAIQAWLARWLRYRFTRGQWIIAVTFGGTWPAERRFDHIIEPPPDRLWADPFVLHENGRTWIFVEEFVYAKARGTIAVIEVRADGTWTQPRRILDRPYHLSYPCVFRWNGGLYMVPESRENRTIDLYRCTEFPDHWELDEVLMRDVDAVDATVFEHDGRWWMYYATDSGDGAGFDRLWLFHAPSPRGPWTQHPHAPLQCDVVGGRPGGRPFVREGRLLRAAQIGTPWYGHAIQLREIVTLTPDAWEERDAGRIDPDWLPGVVGTHTLNDDGGVVVADAQRRRFALLRRAPKIRAPEATYTKVS